MKLDKFLKKSKRTSLTLRLEEARLVGAYKLVKQSGAKSFNAWVNALIARELGEK